MNYLLELSIFSFLMSPLYRLFGWLTRIFLDFFGNYGVAIIVLTVIIRGLLIPLNVRSQRSMLKMQALSGKTAELQRKYGDDKQRYQEELVKMQQENGAMGGMSGCLLPFLQIFFIFPIYRIVSGPLYYLSNVTEEHIDSMVEIAKAQGLIAENAKLAFNSHIPLIEALNNNSTFLSECVNKGLITMGQIINLDFLGMDLSMVPSWNPVTIISDPKTYLPLLMFPILVVIVNVISIRMGQVLRPDHKAQQEAKERAKNNPARAGQNPQEDTSEMTMKMMNWFMPIMMLVTTFTLPAAMGLYWVVGGIMGIVSQVLVYYLFTKPYELKKKELEIKKANAFKKNKEYEGETSDKPKKKKKKNKD